MRDKILIVDDDREIRDVLRILLTGEGFEVAEAAGGEEALGYLENHAQDVDLVILDVMMEGNYCIVLFLYGIIFMIKF